jgi:SOS-response transcriptional repressor LexA
VNIETLRKEFKKRPKPSNITARQAEVLFWIIRCWLTGFIPTLQDISDEFGMKGPSSVICHVEALQRAGYLEETKGRSLWLTDAALNLTVR